MVEAGEGKMMRHFTAKHPKTLMVYDMYFEIFKDYSYKQFNQAVTLCVKSHKYNTLPKPADILEFLEGTHRLQGRNCIFQIVFCQGWYRSTGSLQVLLSNSYP